MIMKVWCLWVFIWF